MAKKAGFNKKGPKPGPKKIKNVKLDDVMDLVDQEASEGSSESEVELDTNKLVDSESESELDSEDDSEEEVDGENDEASAQIGEDEDEEEEEEQEDVPLSDVELDDDADVIPHQKLTINNKGALRKSLASFALPENLAFNETMMITADKPIEMRDIYDDMERELAFYKQGLEAVEKARKLLRKEKIPFSRPVDYFAEMVKSDEHMDKLKQKLVDEETQKKASQEARRQRELKKFGKKVQHARLQEKQKEKRETLEKIKSLKRKRGNNEMSAEDFDIAIEEAAEFNGRDNKRSKGDHKPNAKRMAKNAKYGHGGRKRYSKENTAESSADIFGSGKGGKGKAGKGVRNGAPGLGKPKRLGKSRRSNRR